MITTYTAVVLYEPEPDALYSLAESLFDSEDNELAIESAPAKKSKGREPA